MRLRRDDDAQRVAEGRMTPMVAGEEMMMVLMVAAVHKQSESRLLPLRLKQEAIVDVDRHFHFETWPPHQQQLPSCFRRCRPPQAMSSRKRDESAPEEDLADYSSAIVIAAAAAAVQFRLTPP